MTDTDHLAALLHRNNIGCRRDFRGDIDCDGRPSSHIALAIDLSQQGVTLAPQPDTASRLCDHPCSARVLDSGGWSCRRCEQFCEPPCPTCATGDVPRSGAYALIAAEVEALEGACHDRSGLGCDADPCVENVSRSDVLRIVGSAGSK